MSDVPAPMTPDIRREAEALVNKWYASTLEANDTSYTGHTEEEWVSLEAAIEAFAKAQRVKEVEAIVDRITRHVSFGVSGFEYRAELIDWLSQRAKELEP